MNSGSWLSGNRIKVGNMAKRKRKRKRKRRMIRREKLPEKKR